ncbi:uncharacterized protein LOC114306627 [Camellia sinensis]|uniref:uncharacterized protein LOC114306627 n=1 Tax=Camellia sinensis TaxID=4442 RepID=UPI001036D617|nr:uncharacterized protein LOC114306627 [Camellia sinensis]
MKSSSNGVKYTYVHKWHSRVETFTQLHFEMKDLGSLSYFLGFEISFTPCGLYLTQATYASNPLSRAGLMDSKTAPRLLKYNTRLTLLEGAVVSDATLYRQLTGSLVYVTITQPDISNAVDTINQFFSTPQSSHYVVLLILQYVKGTLFHGLHYSAHTPIELCAYFNAD